MAEGDVGWVFCYPRRGGDANRTAASIFPTPLSR